MSHFAVLKTQVKNMQLAEEVAKNMGWSIEKVDVYNNPYERANESVNNCSLFRNEAGKVCMVVDSKGNVIHDTWSMGRSAFEFLKNYSMEYIRKTATADGGIVHNKGVDAEGNIILEIEYV